jgi:predicted dehydrogenase
MTTVSRRGFLKASVASAAGLSARSYARAADSPNGKVALAVIGIGSTVPGSVGGRGRQLIPPFAGFKDVDVTHLCDVDESFIPIGQKLLTARERPEARVEADFRRILQEKAVDAVVVATPDHWHALMTIWACQAGKHVYVEKPASHNLREGRLMVEAARKYHRVVQLGTQSRSSASLARAAELVRSGKLGKIAAARAWIGGSRPNIGKATAAPVPKGVDYNLWLGPAPERAFTTNRFHYRWHWLWDYGTGEVGNNGIHALDRLRWLLDLDAPTRVVAAGGKFFYDDDQETPDTMTVAFEFPACTVTWEHRVWSKASGSGAELYGEYGTLVLARDGWHVEKGIEASDPGDDKDQSVNGSTHQRNFIDCVKSSAGTSVSRPNADIEIGHKSTRLSHLGNIAFRTGRAVRFDARTETCVGDPEANGLLGRSYRAPFVVPATV